MLYGSCADGVLTSFEVKPNRKGLTEQCFSRIFFAWCALTEKGSSQGGNKRRILKKSKSN